MNEELIAKAKEAKSAEELLALAGENGVEMTEENAKALFERLQSAGELADNELDSVSGGGCGSLDPKCPICGSKDYRMSDRTFTYHLATLHYYLCLNCGHEYI